MAKKRDKITWPRKYKALAYMYVAFNVAAAVVQVKMTYEAGNDISLRSETIIDRLNFSDAPIGASIPETVAATGETGLFVFGMLAGRYIGFCLFNSKNLFMIF